jgi:uncharacterized protein YbjT (DUF2867 family)
MKVAVLGGHGLVGAPIVGTLLAATHRVIGIGRRIESAGRRMPGATWRQLDLATASVDQWAVCLAGADVVVNCAGALQDSAADRLHDAHVEGVRRLIDGARRAGVRRFIQISAAGVASSPGAFGATKRAAETLVAESGLDWLILRPGLVLAPAAYGGSALLRGLAGFPLLIPVLHPESRVQVIAAADVARAVLAALGPGAPAGTAIDLVAPGETTLGDLLRALRRWLGLRPAPLLRVPAPLAGLVARVADALALLGWRSPMRSTTLAQLAAGVGGDSAAAAALLGRQPLDLRQVLAAHPAGVQESWFARLYFLKPVIVLTLALFWILSGVIGLARLDAATAVLLAAGFAEAVARAVVAGGSVLDIALGLMLLHRRAAAPALLGMLAVTAGYLFGATIWLPDLWADPLGPLVKTIPAAVLVLVALAILEER